MKHSTELLTPMQDAEQERPSQDHSPRFGFDQSIRETERYEIESRPVYQPTGQLLEPIWRHKQTGILFTHTDVLRREKLAG